MSTFKNENSLRTIEAQIVQKLKNNEAWPKLTGSYKKKPCMPSKPCAFPVLTSSMAYFTSSKVGSVIISVKSPFCGNPLMTDSSVADGFHLRHFIVSLIMLFLACNSFFLQRNRVENFKPRVLSPILNSKATVFFCFHLEPVEENEDFIC